MVIDVAPLRAVPYLINGNKLFFEDSLHVNLIQRGSATVGYPMVRGLYVYAVAAQLCTQIDAHAMFSRIAISPTVSRLPDTVAMGCYEIANARNFV